MVRTKRSTDLRGTWLGEAPQTTTLHDPVETSSEERLPPKAAFRQQFGTLGYSLFALGGGGGGSGWVWGGDRCGGASSVVLHA